MSNQRSSIITKGNQDRWLKDDAFKLVYSDRDTKKRNHEMSVFVMNLVKTRSSSNDSQDYEEDLENLNAHFGRWNNIPVEGLGAAIDLGDEHGKVTFGRTKVNNHALLDDVGQIVVHDLLNRPSTRKVEDLSYESQIVKRSRTKQEIRNKFRELVYEPLYQDASFQIQRQYGIGDMLALPDEQRQQINFEIEKIMDRNIPKDIARSVEKASVPTARIMKKLLDLAERENELYYKREVGKNYAQAIGKEAYRIRHGFNTINVDNVPMMDADYRLSTKSPMFDEGVYFSYKRYLTPVEIVSEGFHFFEKKHFDDLESLMSGIPTDHYEYNAYRGNGERAHSRHRLTNDRLDLSRKVHIPIEEGGGFVTDGEFKQFMSKATMQGEENEIWSNGVFGRLEDAYLSDRRGIEVEHVSWKWLRKAKMVFRKEGRRLKKHIYSEHYQLNKAANDVKFQWTAIPQTANGNIYAGEFYDDIGPTICQYLKPNDFSSPVHDIVGQEYNSFEGVVKNLSNVQLSKPYQLKYNVISDVLMEAVNNNRGDVLVLDETIIDKYGPKKFFNLLYNFRTIVHGKNTLGGRGYDYSNIRSIPFGNTVDINMLLTVLDYYERKVIDKGGSSKEKMSGLGQYASRFAIRDAANSADLKNSRMYDRSKRIDQRLLFSLMKNAFYAYYDNDELLKSILTDEEYIYMKNHRDEIAGSYIVLSIDETIDEAENLRNYKQIMLNAIASGRDLGDIPELMKSKTLMEAKEVAEKQQDAQQLREQQIMKSNQEQERALAEMNKQEKAEERQFKAAENAKSYDAQRETAYIYALSQANAGDVDNDGRPDFLTNAREQRALEYKMHAERLRMEAKKEKNKKCL